MSNHYADRLWRRYESGELTLDEVEDLLYDEDDNRRRIERDDQVIKQQTPPNENTKSSI